LSNEIVKMHGGEIRVKSTPGAGSVFTIALKKGTSHLRNQNNILFTDPDDPHNRKDNEAEQILRELEIEDSNHAIKLCPDHEQTLLVVEDHAPILDYITDTLSAYFTVITATNGREGLEKVARYTPDLIISDVMMPEMDGMEMTRILKENFDTCHIPVILLTAKSGVDDQIMGLESGAEAYVLKPFNMAILKTMIANMLEQRKLVLRRYRDNKEIEVSDIKFTSRDQEFIDKLIRYIEENYQDSDLSISKLVDFSCVSRTVFYNKVKSLTGLSPIELMRQVKLKIAAQMLAKGYNVNEAAFHIGFNDTRYFSKQFKELFGVSPSQYRKENSDKDDEEPKQS